MPEVASEQSPGHGVVRSRQQLLPLYVHSMLLVPLCARPAEQRKLMARQIILNKPAVTSRDIEQTSSHKQTSWVSKCIEETSFTTNTEPPYMPAYAGVFHRKDEGTKDARWMDWAEHRMLHEMLLVRSGMSKV